MTDEGILGGGGLGYVVQGGEVYIKADDLSGLLSYTGAQMGVVAITGNDQVQGAVAHALLLIAEKTDALKSHILKEEAMASLLAMDFTDDDVVSDETTHVQLPETD